MKIIASSVRKGNVLEIDGKLLVVLSAESFFPGKGTPTTQIDMRRISDGVKTTGRYRTTEQVERATVEERAPSRGWPRDLALVLAAAFYAYQRGAVDYLQ